MAESLLRLFCETLSKQSIIIDGIDECDKAQRKLLLDFWLDVVHKTDDRDPGKIRVAFVSQSYPDIEKLLQDSTVLKVTAKDNQKDIEDYTQSWCDKIQAKYDPNQKHTDKIEFIKKSTCIEARGKQSSLGKFVLILTQ